MKQLKSRGIALIGVLLLIVTLSMLAGAMVAVHRGNWSLARGQDQRIAAHQACLSAIEYARDRLQAEPTWGTTPFGGHRVRLNVTGLARASEQGASLAENTLTFELPLDQCQAVLQVANNLAENEHPLEPEFPRWRHLQVPPQSVLLVVAGQSGSQRRRVELLLRRRPPLDGALYSGEDLAFIPSGSGETRFDGEDATKNKLRARGKVYLPNLARFLSRGAATGKGDVRVGATLAVNPSTGDFPPPTDGTSLKDSPDQQNLLEGNLNASLNVGPVPQIHLDESDLATSSGVTHDLPAGNYTFVAAGKVKFQPASGGPTVLYQDAIYDGGGLSGTPDQVAVSLIDRKFMVQGQVESNGGLELDSVGGLSRPELALGYHPSEGGANEPGKATSLRLKGDLLVRGHLVGQGTVATLKPNPSSPEGNITISGRSTLASGSSTGLALFSEGDLRMRPPEPSGDVTLAADFEALTLGLNTIPSSNPSLLNDVDIFENLPDADPPGAPRGRELLLGQDEWRNPLQISAGNVRDSQITSSDYVNRVQPLIPNWPAKTPGGLDVPPAAVEFVNNCLTESGGDFVGGMTVGRHARLMAFLRSVDDGNEDAGWLTQVTANPNPNAPFQKYNELIKGNLKNQLQRVAQDARLQGVSPSQWLITAGDHYRERDRRDIDWRGLLYAKGKLWGVGNEHIDIVGSLGSETGSLVFSGFKSSRVKFHHSELNTIFRESSLRLEGYSWYLD